MLKLEEIKKDAQVKGIVANEIVKVIAVEKYGDDALTVYFKGVSGKPDERMLFRTDEANLEIASIGKNWGFDAEGNAFKIGLEAFRISEAAMFDPMMAVYTSNVQPLPHQISAVYESMLPRQPLRYVLADDPGAGKTIMAGLFIRELLLRADAKRILIVSPGSLSGQWQDELREKFGIEFEIFSKEKMEQAGRNFFAENDLLICRLDQLSRNEEYQEKLKLTEWDLIIVDEAHKLSANYFGNKVNKTQRFKLGELLGSITRHYLLMTATPHNGKEEDFQVWLSLLDADRFYGKFREGAHKVDVSDMMRRMVKEELLKFDGTPLFPERRAYTANYELSDIEAELYDEVTNYVRNQMNLADRLDGKRKGTVGFALTLLQRRLASSPEAIYQSLRRRKTKLEAKLNELKISARAEASTRYGGVAESTTSVFVYDKRELFVPDDIDEYDEEMNPDEYEMYAEQVVDQATAAETIPELEKEIEILKGLQELAFGVVESQSDKKWEELSNILQQNDEMFMPNGRRRKLIIFTEHKDTLNYLIARIRSLLGTPEAVVEISGATNRDQRRKVQEEFRNNPDVIVLIATDAAGEGVNLQNANLMVNYDLPWNPNRLEQRFGRIHRIGQTEVCHLWNIVANQTREGEVFQKLFEKLEIERKALGGKVFDILGEAFENKSLKELLIDAIRYGESPETRAKMNQVIDNTLDTNRLKEILKRNALVEQHMDISQLYLIKEEMEKAEARKLQPHFIRTFFADAFERLGGELKPREGGRFEITRVPATIRERDRVISETRTPVLTKYERVCFEKDQVRIHNKPMADLIHPKHPLMHSVLDLILEENRAKLKQGAILVDPNDEGTEPKLMFMISHAVRQGNSENAKVLSRRLQFVSIDKNNNVSFAGYAPHLDYEPIKEQDNHKIATLLDEPWLQSSNLESMALGYASSKLVPEHFETIKTRADNHADKALRAVHERLTKEINYQYGRAIKLEEDVKSGKQPSVQPENFKRRAEELTARLEQRTKELQAAKDVVSTTPIIIGGALIIPKGLLESDANSATFSADAIARSNIEKKAMDAVMAAEIALGHTVFDRSADKCGWDITARPMPDENGVIKDDRHIEVKGRQKGNTTITVTKNEIFTCFNQGEKFILAIVLIDGDEIDGPHYIKNPFKSEPGFAVASINFELSELMKFAQRPEETI